VYETINRFAYMSNGRKAGERRVDWNSEEAFAQTEGKVYPFYARAGDYRVFAVRRLTFRSIEGEILRSYKFFEDTALPADRVMDAEAMAVTVETERIEYPARVRINVWQPDLSLVVEGTVNNPPVPLRVELFEGEKMAASRSVDVAGAFRWEVPLGLLKAAAPITLRGTGSGGAIVPWKVTRIGLSRRKGPALPAAR
jgi:hypothetical protein